MKYAHLSVFFSNAGVEQSTGQKHLGIHLDQKLEFNVQIKGKINKGSKRTDLIRKPQSKLPRNALLTIYKHFIRPHLDSGDIVYDQLTNDSFGRKLESVQDNAALAVTGAIE